MVFAANLVEGAALTVEEIQQIESEFGITLTTIEKDDLAADAKPDAPHPQWRIDADARIDLNRKADLDVQVVDSVGTPVPGAQVVIKLNRNAFKFGGTFSARDFNDTYGNLNMSTDDYKDRLLSMFNGVGLNNGFKPRLTNIHTYIPGVLSWAQANDLPVRGHLLMWPGGGDLADLDDPAAVSGVDYGTHLSRSGTSAYAHYDVLGAVDIYKASARTQADKAALKAVIDAEVQEWAGRWGVYEWDVINETLGNHLLQDILGDDQMAEWFRVARSNKVSADCKLLINEYQIISSMSEERKAGWYTDRRDRYMVKIDRLIADGTPPDRIGFQSRIKQERRDPQLIYDRLEEWGNTYGLEMVGTEFEVVDSDPGAWKEYIYTDDERAEITEEMMTQYYSHPLVTGLNAWNTINDDVDALVDYSGHPTRNGLVWYYVHRIRYMTDTSGTTDVAGTASARAFKGDYDITISYNGTDYPATLTLASNQTAVVVLGDVSVEPGPVPVPVWVALEEFTLTGGVDGTRINTVPSTTGTDSVLAGAVENGQDIQGEQVHLFGAGTGAGFGSMTDASYAGATGGSYEISYTMTSADMTVSSASNTTAQVGFGFRFNDGANRDLRTLFRFDSSDNFLLSMTTAEGAKSAIIENGLVLSAPLTVRQVLDMDAGTYSVYYTLGTAAEVEAYTGDVFSGQTLGEFRQQFQTINGGNNMQAGDSFYMDNITLSERQLMITPESHYAFWLTDYPTLGSFTNLVDNPDGDPLNNLAEYALGGDPANGADVGHVPANTMLEVGGTNYFEYVYAKRNDAADRGLIYSLELSTDLVSNVWTNGDIEVVGTGTLDAAFDSVTNRVPMVGEEQGFIRLRIEWQ